MRNRTILGMMLAMLAFMLTAFAVVPTANAAPSSAAVPAHHAIAAASSNQVDGCGTVQTTSLWERDFCDDTWFNAGGTPGMRVQGQQYHYFSANVETPQMVRLDSSDGIEREWRFYCYNSVNNTSSAEKWHIYAYHVLQSDVPQYACGQFKGSGIIITGQGAACGTTYITNAYIGSVPQFSGSNGNYAWAAVYPERYC